MLPKLHGNVIPLKIARRQNNPTTELLNKSRTRTRCITIASKEVSIPGTWRPMSIRRAMKLHLGEFVSFLGTNNHRVAGVIIGEPTTKGSKLVVIIACNGIVFEDFSNGRTMDRLLEPENDQAKLISQKEIESAA